MTVEVAMRGVRGSGAEPFAYDVAFTAAAELFVLYGHSGAGKTLALRAIAGLERPRAGRIAIAGTPVFDAGAGIDLPPQRRRVGYVVQDPTLFPHLDVRANVLIGVERDAAARERWEHYAAAFEIGALAARRPFELSGGQQQRVALARALVRPTRALLLDEPFAALDEALREGLRRELVALQRESGLPVVFVTHDLREAHLLADRIAVIDGGRVLQVDTPARLFRRAASRRVAALTGVRNLWEGHVEGGRVVVSGLALALPPDVDAAGPVDVGVRAERCNLRRHDPDGPLPPNCLVARVAEDLGFGNTHTLRLVPEGPGPTVVVEVAARPYEVLGVAHTARWVVELPADDLQIMPRATAGHPG